MELRLDKKQEDEFIKTVLNSIREQDPKKFLKIFNTKEELSKLIEIYQPKGTFEAINKQSNNFAKESSDDLFDNIKKHIKDIDKSVLTTDYDLKEENGILVIKRFYIFLKTSKTHHQIMIRTLYSIENRIFWDGWKVNFNEVEPEPEKVEFIGNYQDVAIDNLVGCIEDAYSPARVYDNLVVKGDLDLDRLQDDGIYTLIVNGDLEVHGSILNEGWIIGSTLNVKGKTSAKNLIGGGAIISLNEVIIEDFTIGHRNDGILSLTSLKTNIFMNDDHHTEIIDYSKINISIDYDDEYNLGKKHIKDINSLSKFILNNKELTNVIDTVDDEYSIDYDFINYLITQKTYMPLQKQIVNFASKII